MLDGSIVLLGSERSVSESATKYWKKRDMCEVNTNSEKNAPLLVTCAAAAGAENTGTNAEKQNQNENNHSLLLSLCFWIRHYL
jgi:hypothetical protein